MQQTINIPEGYELVQTSETSYEIKKKTNLPKTWEEFCEKHKKIKEGECFIGIDSYITDVGNKCKERDEKFDRNLLPSKSDAEGILALIQLIQLRNCYNEGWKPDWEDGGLDKYSICYSKNKATTSVNFNTHRILSFKTTELRDRFFTNFKDLIKTAKDFI